MRMEPSEKPLLVNTTQAAKLLGVSLPYVSALKKAVGCSGSHRFKLDWLTDYLDKHPNFRVRQNVPDKKTRQTPA